MSMAPLRDQPAVDVDTLTDRELCLMHPWTCIWCSMPSHECESCLAVTPPCPANGLVHRCACHTRGHEPPPGAPAA